MTAGIDWRISARPLVRGRGSGEELFLVQDFSQYGEQPIILDYFERHPGAPRYCVDAGAFDGITGSNSRALFLIGWSGVLVEPDPRTFARLKHLYADRADVTCLRKALSDKVRLRRMQFTDGPPGTKQEDQWQYAQVNTLSKPFAMMYKRDYDYIYRTSWIWTTTLMRALRKANAPRDMGFMSIDCEGEDIKVVKQFDFSRYRPRLLCLESDENTRNLFLDILAPYGYTYRVHTAANTFFSCD
jgi:FkbM family methyltransferase